MRAEWDYAERIGFVGMWWRVLASTGRPTPWHYVHRIDRTRVPRCGCFGWPRLMPTKTIQISRGVPVGAICKGARHDARVGRLHEPTLHQR
jgi:hypothetical protein